MDRERLEIERLLDDNPSLRPALGDIIASELSSAPRLAARSLARYGETSAAVLARSGGGTFTQDQILGDWWPVRDHPA